MIGRPNICPISKKEPLSTTASMIWPHLVDLAAVARDRRENSFSSRRSVGSVRSPRAGRLCTEEGRYDRKRRAHWNASSSVSTAWSTAPARHCTSQPPSSCLLEVLADAGHHRRARHEHGRRGLGHDRVVAGRQPRRAEARHRAQAQRDHGNGAEVVGEILVVELGDAELARQVGAAGRLDGLDRAAAARALDDADDRQPQLVAPCARRASASWRWWRRPSRRAP